MLTDGDPIATALYAKYRRIRMPNLSLNEEDVQAVIEYLNQSANANAGAPSPRGWRFNATTEPVGNGSVIGMALALCCWIAFPPTIHGVECKPRIAPSAPHEVRTTPHAGATCTYMWVSLTRASGPGQGAWASCL
jgi:hypothetical protein